MTYLFTTLKQWSALIALVLFTSLSACDDEDPPLPDNVVSFESTQLGITEDESSVTVNINFSRETTADAEITITTQLNGLTYDTEFHTEPAMTGNTLVISVPKGSTNASFQIIKKEGIVLLGDETIIFTINSVGNDLVVTEGAVLTVSFSEILATAGTMDPNVGGEQQPNKVFIDLSANRQTAMNRGDWDLGFYTADNEFRVILNSSAAMMARSVDKTDLTLVSEADTTGWGTQLSTDGVFAAINTDPVPDWVSQSIAWIDAPNGDLSGTAIAEVSADEGENKVYVINRGKNPDGSERGWKKIRVLRNGNNYSLQHADINATSFTTVEIPRNSDYLFTYVKLESGVVQIEPEKDAWDIAFTVFTNSFPLGPGVTIPYVYNDIVIQNRYSTETAELLVANAGSYDAFDAADIPTATFSASQVNIGSKWRSGGGPGSGPALKEDRFYLIKDSAGNIYKLKFTALTQNGERGRPQIQFALLTEGE